MMMQSRLPLGLFDTIPSVLLLCASIVVVGLIVWLILMHKRWVRPARLLGRTAQRMAAGNWAERSIPAGAPAMADLSDRINHLARQVRKQLGELSRQQADLQALVDALPDPILVVDGRNRIATLNAAAERLLSSIAPITGRAFQDVVSDATVLSLFDEAAALPVPPEGEDPQQTHREMKLYRDGKRLSYQAVAQRTTSGGVLMVLRDVSTMAGAIQMKTDFVANASHELRTPISAIKVAFETLRTVHEEDPNLTRRCIDIVDGQINRLEEMLRDLMDLSRVETADLKPAMARLRVDDLLDSLKVNWQPIARAKGVVFEVRLADENAEFVSDRRLLEMVLKNLVENAIKFTPAQGRVQVLFDLMEDGSGVISVEDTGCGIPGEHLDRVFERFYQVDPARSGTAGRGTGLGLAIVKHAVHALGGSIHIQSKVGVGTVVSCKLPAIQSPLIDEPLLTDPA